MPATGPLCLFRCGCQRQPYARRTMPKNDRTTDRPTTTTSTYKIINQSMMTYLRSPVVQKLLTLSSHFPLAHVASSSSSSFFHSIPIYPQIAHLFGLILTLVAFVCVDNSSLIHSLHAISHCSRINLLLTCVLNVSNLLTAIYGFACSARKLKTQRVCVFVHTYSAKAHAHAE